VSYFSYTTTYFEVQVLLLCRRRRQSRFDSFDSLVIEFLRFSELLFVTTTNGSAGIDRLSVDHEASPYRCFDDTSHSGGEGVSDFSYFLLLLFC
jgi:hypothetical protein